VSRLSFLAARYRVILSQTSFSIAINQHKPTAVLLEFGQVSIATRQ